MRPFVAKTVFKDSGKRLLSTNYKGSAISSCKVLTLVYAKRASYSTVMSKSSEFCQHINMGYSTCSCYEKSISNSQKRILQKQGTDEGVRPETKSLLAVRE